MVGEAKTATDGRPTAFQALKAIVADLDTGEVPIERGELHILSNGEVVYRFYPADGGEYYGGVTSV